jgi:hypothetical protein
VLIDRDMTIEADFAPLLCASCTIMLLGLSIAGPALVSRRRRIG